MKIHEQEKPCLETNLQSEFIPSGFEVEPAIRRSSTLHCMWLASIDNPSSAHAQNSPTKKKAHAQNLVEVIHLKLNLVAFFYIVDT